MTQTLPDSLCYLNGQFGPLADARVSVLDRGFIHHGHKYFNGRLGKQ